MRVLLGMIGVGRWVLLFLVAICLAGCGSGGECQHFCEAIKPMLIDQLPNVQPEDVRCSEPPWTETEGCDACLQIVEDLYDTSVTNEPDACAEYFGE